MKNFAIYAALAAVAAIPSAAQAQAVPAAKIAIVDLQRVGNECTACKAAAATLQSQIAALRTRSQQLEAGIAPEGKALQTAVTALNGKEPDAALAARVRAFQTKRENGAVELQRQQTQIQRNQQYISQQIDAKLRPLFAPAMQRRGANILLDTDSTLAASAGIDITNDVLAALNAALPSVATTAPAAPAPASR